MALDTLAMQRRLRDAGLTDQLASAIIRELADAVADEIATKPDLTDLQALRNELYAVRNELKADITQVRDEVAQVRGEVAQVRGEVAQVRGEVAQLRTEIARLESRMSDSRVSSARWSIATIATIALGFAGIIVALVLAG